jgi:signal transduction histidine kinase
MKLLAKITILFLALTGSLFSHDNIDSLKTILPFATGKDKVKVLNDLSKAYWGRSPDTTIEYANQALELARGIKDRAGEATALKNTGVAYHVLGDCNRSLEYYKKSYKIYEEIMDSTGMGNCLNNIGTIYNDLSDYDTALEYYLKSERIYDSLCDTSGIAASYINIGNIYDVLREDEKALENFQISLKLNEQIGDNDGAAICLNNIGNIQSDLGDNHKALEYYQKSLLIYEQTGDPSGIGTAYINIGYAYDELGDSEMALQYYRKALDIYKDFGDKQGIAIILNNIGDASRKLKNYSQAHEYLDSSIALSQEIGSKDMLKENYECFAKLYADLGDYQKALENYKLFSAIKDSIFTDDRSNQITEMQTKYDTEKKEKENELLRKETEIHQATIKRQNIITISIGVGLALVIGLVIVMIRANNTKRKTNGMLQEQKRHIENQANELKQANDRLIELDHFKEGMTGMIVHDLKNPLSAIMNYSEDKDDHSQVVIHQAGKQMLNMVMNILDVQKFEGAQMKLETEDNNLYQIAGAATDQVDFLSREKGIDIINSIPKDLSVVADSGIIERVFINLLTNSIKYTPNSGKVILETIFQADNTVRVMVSDSGEGIPKDKLTTVFDKFQQVQPKKSSKVRSTGLGLTFCKLAVESHGGKIGVYSEIDEGTTFWFTLKKSDVTATIIEPDKSGNTTELALSILDKENLIQYIKLFENLEIYEISGLRNILRQIQPDSNLAVKLWKDEMQRAVYAVNEDKYRQLMKI